MKFLINKKLIVFSCICYIILIGFRVNNPPDGNTGAPGEGTCASCHGGGNPNIDGEVMVTGIPETIEASTLYNVTVTVTNPNGNAVRGGFQMVVLDEADENSGTLTNPGPSSDTDPDNGRMYFEHRPALNFGAGTEVSYTVDWTAPDGPNDEEITFYAAGNVANGNGSTSLDRIVTTTTVGTLNAPVDPVMVTIVNIVDVSCVGEDDGSAMALAVDGTPPYSYLWDNGETTMIATMLTAGLHSVTVTDQSDDTASASAIIGMPPALSLDITSQTDALCNGDSNGTASVQGNGGTPGYTYNWPGGLTGPNQNALSAGNYVVTVTDNNGCTATNIVVISEPDLLLLLVINTQDVSCNGGTDGVANLAGSGGTPSYTFNWPDGNMNATRLDLAAGSYTVTMTDQNNCIATNIVNIGEPNLLVANASATDETSGGAMDGTATANPFGGTPDYGFNWSNGETSQTIENLSGGDYTVTVTDVNGCTSVETVTVEGVDCNLLVTVENDTLNCNGDANGMLIAGISGQQGPVIIQWSNGSSNDTINNLAAGEYSVTVTDSLSCMSIDTAVVVEPDLLQITCDTVIHVLCFGDSTGSVSISISGGTQPYNYNWSDGSSTEDLNNIPSGNYNLTVTDANGCSSTKSVMVNQPDQLLANASATNETSSGAGDGTATANPTGGIQPYSYLWSNDSTTQTINNLDPGNYTVVVTDANNCTATETVTVGSDGCPLMADIVVTHVLCNGDSSGSISLELTDETPPISFIWSTGDTTQIIENQPAGTYFVTVTDADLCVIDLSTVITEPDPLELDITVLNTPECPDSADGKVECVASEPNTTFLWSNGITDAQLCDVPPGEYCVTVTNQNGCTSIACVELSSNDTLPPILLLNDITVYLDQNGNVPNISFDDINNGSSDNCSMVSPVDTLPNLNCDNLGDNPIDITITDTSGNTTSGSFTATVEDTFPPLLLLNDLNIFADAGGNFPDLTFDDLDNGTSDNCGTFTDNVGTLTFTCDDVGVADIGVEVTDGSGNTAASFVAVNVLDTFPPLIICIMDFTVNVCSSVEYSSPITTDNCGAPVPELVSGLESGSSFPVGTTEIVFRATDNSGNSAECSFNVTVEVDLAVDIETTDARCFDFSDGQVAYTITGGTPPFNVTIDPVQSDTTTLHAGNYFITVEDSEGCSVMDSFEILEPEILIISAFEVTDETNSPGNDGAIAITVNGGTMDYTYSWTKDGEFFSNEEDLSGLGAGEYVCTVTDANGCMFISETIVVQKGTSIIDHEFDSSIHIFPNPNSGNFIIEVEDAQLTELNLQLFNVTGSRIFSEAHKVFNKRIEIDKNIMPGLYFVKIQSDNKIALKRIIIQD